MRLGAVVDVVVVVVIDEEVGTSSPLKTSEPDSVHRYRLLLLLLVLASAAACDGSCAEWFGG